MTTRRITNEAKAKSSAVFRLIIRLEVIDYFIDNNNYYNNNIFFFVVNSISISLYYVISLLVLSFDLAKQNQIDFDLELKGI